MSHGKKHKHITKREFCLKPSCGDQNFVVNFYAENVIAKFKDDQPPGASCAPPQKDLVVARIVHARRDKTVINVMWEISSEREVEVEIAGN